jgi:AraC family transcriptional regulator of adaptative response/methylated-DNA-[protein]-cysteine methyltransferase
MNSSNALNLWLPENTGEQADTVTSVLRDGQDESFAESWWWQLEPSLIPGLSLLLAGPIGELAYCGLQAETSISDDICKRWPQCKLKPQPSRFRGAELSALPLRLIGTSFQLQVWHALSLIPWAQTVSYSAVAVMINKPAAVRAIGSAIGANPLSLLLPCHRVLRSDGSLGGYYWGLALKQQLLNFEQQNHTLIRAAVR